MTSRQQFFDPDRVELEITRALAIADDAAALGNRNTAAMARGRAHCLTRILHGTDTVGAAQNRLTLDLRGSHGLGRHYMLGEYGAIEFLIEIGEYRPGTTRSRKHSFLSAITRAWARPLGPR